ncbi:tellurite resistance/C4-dicarboxylate transporter family protein [Anaeromyxobacter diazotrophicus]|uniref:C4-dicarboxylate transporter n=1 Tax=Anaeromyxobacter diazotrophicus TaxID=2590199 RepID=A0A7I9VKM3_9BACT|nr:tellurite resistance/C4-dicarboxylate transporter family protein [Anaeromyxobacter diazotrophicus]GEJ56966.1 C4-dicarboxylate transporter [Anaeromyxobacter diazotrophicus]
MPEAAPTTLRRAVEGLHPSYFALVMATGIVAIALHLQGARPLALALGAVAAAAYLALALLTLARIALYPRAVLLDLAHHGRAVGFFTTVAATGVLGADLVVLAGRRSLALALWWLAAVLWLGLTYAVFTALTVKERKPTLAEGIHGGWLLAVVATQAVANLGALLLPALGGRAEAMSFASVTVWLAGGMLYVWIISLIFYRYTFFTLQPSDLMPPYWINMGAMAISTLAGATLLLGEARQPLVHALLPFVRGTTLLCWATATWWIPMLLVLGAWRHVYRRYPLAYDPLYWGAVFPLGMYSVCTQRLAQAMGLPFLLPVARAFAWIALAAWCAAFAGLLRTLGAGAARLGRPRAGT